MILRFLEYYTELLPEMLKKEDKNITLSNEFLL